MINGTTITLSTPVTIDGATHSQLALRKIRLGDVEAISVCQTEVGAVALLAARLADVDIEVIRNLEMADTETLMDAIIEQLSTFRKKIQ